jgi:hypothetical protein
MNLLVGMSKGPRIFFENRRAFVATAGIASRVFLVPTAGVALERARGAVMDLAHDLDRAVAIRTDRHLRARQNWNDAHRSFAAVAFGRGSQNVG